MPRSKSQELVVPIWEGEVDVLIPGGGQLQVGMIPVGGPVWNLKKASVDFRFRLTLY